MAKEVTSRGYKIPDVNEEIDIGRQELEDNLKLQDEELNIITEKLRRIKLNNLLGKNILPL